jgi:polyphosphate glucokinase
MTAARMVEAAKKLADDWTWHSVSVGVPSPVHGGRLVAEPVNLGDGWVGFDYEAAFGKPTKVVNDAAMQALGSYEGGKMLFIGLGTGVGSALVANGFVQPMELGHLPYKGRRSRITPATPPWRREAKNAGTATLQTSSPS